jgi:hypothetical protein
MNESVATPSTGNRLRRRIRGAFVYGTSLTVLCFFALRLVPSGVAKWLFWPGLLFVKTSDDDVGAVYFYLFAVPISIVAYSLIFYLIFTIRGIPRPSKN